MKRRSFLKFLGIAPVAAVVAPAIIRGIDHLEGEVVHISESAVAAPPMTATEVKSSVSVPEAFLDEYNKHLVEAFQRHGSLLSKALNRA